MADYESEIQQLLYDQLIGNTTIKTAIGYSAGDVRVYLEWNEADQATISSTKKGYIVIETLQEDAPVGEKVEVNQRAILHLYTALTDRATRKTVRDAIKALFQNTEGGGGLEEQWSTTSYLVWTKTGGVGQPYEDRGLLVVPVYIDLRYIEQ